MTIALFGLPTEVLLRLGPSLFHHHEGVANKIPSFLEELLAVGLLRGEGDVFLSGVGTGKLLMLLKSS